MSNIKEIMYKCDKCEKEIYSKERYGIFVVKSVGSPKKTWDLCKRCYKIIEKEIEKMKYL